MKLDHGQLYTMGRCLDEGRRLQRANELMNTELTAYNRVFRIVEDVRAARYPLSPPCGHDAFQALDKLVEHAKQELAKEPMAPSEHDEFAIDASFRERPTAKARRKKK